MIFRDNEVNITPHQSIVELRAADYEERDVKSLEEGWGGAQRVKG